MIGHENIYFSKAVYLRLLKIFVRAGGVAGGPLPTPAADSQSLVLMAEAKPWVGVQGRDRTRHLIVFQQSHAGPHSN